jgi:probable F420-dependent oxidoreductase
VSNAVKFGVHVPQWGRYANRSGVLEVARAAEDAGLDSVWVADHIVYPRTTDSRYPYRGDGLPFTPEDGFLEAFTTLAVIAGATERIALGTSVLVLPMREPLLAAKTIATLDVLSAGRVILALGAGWWREEFDAVGAPFDGRGSRFDEQLRIMRAAWSDGWVSGTEDAFDFAEVAVLPRPVQADGPPLLIGGMGPAALRRAVRYGDGWHAVGGDVEAIRTGRLRIAELAEQNGRDPATIATSTSTGFSRTPERTRQRIADLAAAGVDQIILNVAKTDATPDDVRAAIDTFATDVRPTLDGLTSVAGS